MSNQARVLQAIKQAIDFYPSISIAERPALYPVFAAHYGLATLETWREAIRYADDRSKALNQEVEQLQKRGHEIARHIEDEELFRPIPRLLPDLVPTEERDSFIQSLDEIASILLIADLVMERREKDRVSACMRIAVASSVHFLDP